MSEAGAWQEWSKSRYRITTDPGALDLDTVHGFLSTAPWATGLSRTALAEAIAHSLCFSLFEDQTQIGVARAITDYITYAYLCDVYVAETHRGRGLGKWMMRCVLAHSALGQLKRIALLTHDSEAFYRKLGFGAAKHDSIYLERLRTPNLPMEIGREKPIVANSPGRNGK